MDSCLTLATARAATLTTTALTLTSTALTTSAASATPPNSHAGQPRVRKHEQHAGLSVPSVCRH